jgi:hypothetical protein
MSLKVGVIIFGFYQKKVTKPKKKLKKNQNRFKLTGFGSVRFGFLGQKLVQIGLARFSSLARFSQFWLGFFLFGSVFAVWLGLGSIRFFWFFAYKTKTEPNRPFFSKF